MWHGIATPGPESGPGFFIFKVKVVEIFEVVPFSLGSGAPVSSFSLQKWPIHGTWVPRS